METLLRNVFFGRLAPLLIFMISLALSIIGSGYVYYSIHRENKLRFQAHSDTLVNQIRNRLERYQSALIQTRSLFSAGYPVTREVFKRYVDGLGLFDMYPGIQGLGYVQKVARADLRRHEASIKNEGFPEYRVWPLQPERAEYFPVVYIEPFDWRNQRAFGYDMTTESARNSTMTRAMETGKPAMTEVVRLVQETAVNPQSGFLLYVPVYEPDLPTETVEQRSKALRGFIYSPYRAVDFFEALFGKRNSPGLETDFEVYSNVQPNEIELLYDHIESPKEYSRWRGSTFDRTVYFEFGGTLWQIAFHSLPAFVPNYQRYSPFVVFLAGVLLSLLFFAMATERQRLMIEHSQRLEESILARDEFLSIASHELKTPITSLKLEFQLAAKLIAANNPEVYSKERVERRISIANRQLERMANLIEDMLDVSRITTGKLAMNIEAVNLPTLVEEVLDRFSEQVRSAGIELKRDIPRSTIVIEADRYRLEQLLDNLLTNAIKYGEGRPIEVNVRALASRVEISIRDHGMGIAQENLNRIFQRFERVASPTNIAGLGIGLYVSKKIVEAQGGSISVDSQLGQGSTFLIRLPYRQTKRLSAA